MNRFRLVVLLILLLASAIYFGYYLYNKPMDKVEDLKSIQSINAKELYVAFDQNEDLANKNYLDKVIEVNGQVDTVMKNENGGLVIILSTGGEIGSVTAELDPGIKPAHSTFDKGEKITVKGVCAGKLIDVVLNRCIVK